MPITTFKDLEVYQNTYKAAILVATQIIPRLSLEEQRNLGSQMRRSSKAILAIIAESYARKNHQKDWQEYLDQAIGECDEMIVRLSFCHDLNHPEQELCKELIDLYDKSGKQLYNLGKNWRVYGSEK